MSDQITQEDTPKTTLTQSEKTKNLPNTIKKTTIKTIYIEQNVIESSDLPKINSKKTVQEETTKIEESKNNDTQNESKIKIKKEILPLRNITPLQENKIKCYTERNKPKPLNIPKNKNLTSCTEIRTKSVERGGKYNNIRITHVVYGAREKIDNYKFKINENELKINMDKKPLDLKKIKETIKKNDRAKSTYKSSCDNRHIQKVKEKQQPKVVFYQHVCGVGMTNLPQNMLNPKYYKSDLRPIIRNKKKCSQPIVQVIEEFRSQQSDYNTQRNTKFKLHQNTNNIKIISHYNIKDKSENHIIQKNTKNTSKNNNINKCESDKESKNLNNQQEKVEKNLNSEISKIKKESEVTQKINDSPKKSENEDGKNLNDIQTDTNQCEENLNKEHECAKNDKIIQSDGQKTDLVDENPTIELSQKLEITSSEKMEEKMSGESDKELIMSDNNTNINEEQRKKHQYKIYMNFVNRIAKGFILFNDNN